MNNYKIIWSPKAITDLENISSYIEHSLKQTYNSINTIKKILNSISNLNHFPERYSKIFYYIDKSRNIRKLPINKYVVIYEVDNISRESLYLAYISLQSKLY